MQNMMKRKLTTSIVTLSLSTAVLMSNVTNAQSSRDTITAVGSSTVYPFSTVVAERFGKSTAFNTPKIESTGTGGGMKLFCTSNAIDTPDLSNASRRMKKSEFDMCVSNGVTSITEVLLGYDGIVVAMAGNTDSYSLTADHLYQALAKYVPAQHGDKSVIPNPYEYWSDIDAKLPKQPILVYGPPPSSGTREAFVDLILRRGCDNISWISVLSVINPQRYDVLCSQIREDGVYLSVGENDQVIVQRLQLHKHAMGVFGFGVLLKNAEMLNAVSIDGFEPSSDTIANNQYHLARPLYFYVKAAHYGLIPGLRDYVDQFMSANAWGYHGYLARKGMVPLSAPERARQRQKVDSNTYLTEQDWSKVTRRSLYEVGNAN